MVCKRAILDGIFFPYDGKVFAFRDGDADEHKPALVKLRGRIIAQNKLKIGDGAFAN